MSSPDLSVSPAVLAAQLPEISSPRTSNSSSRDSSPVNVTVAEAAQDIFRNTLTPSASPKPATLVGEISSPSTPNPTAQAAAAVPEAKKAEEDVAAAPADDAAAAPAAAAPEAKKGEEDVDAAPVTTTLAPAAPVATSKKVTVIGAVSGLVGVISTVAFAALWLGKGAALAAFVGGSTVALGAVGTFGVLAYGTLGWSLYKALKV